MKTLLLSATTFLACLTALAQGRISFSNDSLRLLYYQDMPGHTNGEAVYAGNTGPYTFMADLYLGTASDSLSLTSSTTLSSVAPGKWNTISVIAPFPGGTTVFVVTQIRDASQAPAPTWTPFMPLSGTGSFGVSQEFQFILGTSPFIYPPMYSQGTTPGTGNWAPGTQNMDAYAPGFRGAIAVGFIPEPSALSLVALGTGLLLAAGRKCRSRFGESHGN